MSNDSISQLMQVRSRSFSDWHAPLMAIIWVAAEHVVAGPFGMLVLQTAFFWTGLALLANRITAPVWLRASFLLVLALAPPILSLAGTIWKDVFMVSLLTLAFGVADRRLAFWPVALLATASRHNAIPAVALAVLLHLSPQRVSLRGIGYALAASAAMLVTSLWFNYAVSTDRTHPMQMFVIGDVAGIAAATDKVPAVDSCHFKDSATIQRGALLDEPKIAAAAVAATTRLTTCSDDGAWQRLLDQWLTLVSAHPRAYAAVRTKLAREQLGIDGTPGNFLMAGSFYDATGSGIEPAGPPSPVQDWLGARLRDLERFRIFRPCLYGALALVASGVAAWRGRLWPCCIALSGLACELGLFFVAPSPEYRYSYWMIVAALISALWLAAETIGAWLEPRRLSARS